MGTKLYAYPWSPKLKISTKLQAYHWSPALKTLGTLNIKGKLQWLSGRINLLNCKIYREVYFYEMYKLFTVQNVQNTHCLRRTVPEP